MKFIKKEQRILMDIHLLICEKSTRNVLSLGGSIGRWSTTIGYTEPVMTRNLSLQYKHGTTVGIFLSRR